MPAIHDAARRPRRSPLGGVLVGLAVGTLLGCGEAAWRQGAERRAATSPIAASDEACVEAAAEVDAPRIVVGSIPASTLAAGIAASDAGDLEASDAEPYERGDAQGDSQGDTRPEEGPSVASSEPIGVRVSRRSTLVYAAPRQRWRTRRGEISAGQPFAIHGLVAGSECGGEGWAAVAGDGYVCLEDARPSDAPARPLPELLPGRRTPFVYAKPRTLDRARGTIAEVPRYRDRMAFARHEAPLDRLGPDRFYAFVGVKKWGSTTLLVDEDDRAVPTRGLKIADESDHRGRDLEVAPIPEGLHAGWSVSRPATLRAEPRRRGRAIGEVAYHAVVDVRPAPIEVRGDLWYAVPGAGVDGADAYIAGRDLNRWIPGLPLAGIEEVEDDTVWIDVELGQQTLALVRGDQPIWITLVSSGANGADTPTGIFRIHEKLAITDMRSAPGATHPYHVEAVPWVQYFAGRVALHASFWHDDFGKRRSHGCVNLSPEDAAHVFARTAPGLPDGWNSVRDPEGSAGTVIRVRHGLEAIADRREDAASIDDAQDGAAAVEIEG